MPPDSEERFNLLSQLQAEHPGFYELMQRVGIELADAIHAGDDERAEDWRQMIGELENLGRTPS